jgi:hypothetical protein
MSDDNARRDAAIRAFLGTASEEPIGDVGEAATQAMREARQAVDALPSASEFEVAVLALFNQVLCTQNVILRVQKEFLRLLTRKG